MAAAVSESSRGMMSSFGSFLRTASGSSFEWAADVVGLGVAGWEDEAGLPLPSDSFGEPEDSPLWPRFYAVWGGDGATREAAEAKWRISMRWRAESDIDSALQRPQPYFHALKRVYPHCFHKRARDGRVVVIERGDAFASMVAAFEEAEAEPQHAALHAALLNEFLATHLDPAAYPRGRVVRIFDCEDLSAWELGTSALSFARTVAAVLGPNYPERISRVYIVNAPQSFTIAYSLFSTVLTRRLLDKVHLFSATPAGKESAAEALLQVIAPESLPQRYGGTCCCQGQGGCWRNSPEERALWTLVNATTPPEHRCELPCTAAA